MATAQPPHTPGARAAAPNVALAQALAAKNMTPRTLARALGINVKTVERWIDGAAVPQKANARPAADALGIPVQMLWPELAELHPGASGLADPPPPTADLTAVFLTRNEFQNTITTDRLFGSATTICVSGLSLNMLCQGYRDVEIARLLRAGTTIRALFLDPDGRHIGYREEEEEYQPGVLSNLTRTNIATLVRIGVRLPAEAAANLQIRTYDEPLRFNLTLVDDTGIVQPYLPHGRGLDAPTFMIENTHDAPGLFEVFTEVFEDYWNRGEPIT